jgi:hypothetical protein
MNINSARRTMWIWVVVTMIFICGIFAPSWLGIDGFHGGYAISFFCILLAATGIVVVFIYLGRARTMTGILSHKQLLAHWTYTPEQWQAFSSKEFRQEGSEKWRLYCFVMLIILLVCVAFWLFNRDSGPVMIIIAVGLAIILAATVWLTTSYNYWQNKKRNAGILITKEGALVNGTLHLWRSWDSKLEHVEYDEGKNLILIRYLTPNRWAQNTYTVRIPVPEGEEDTAHKVAHILKQDVVLSSDDT